MALMRAERNVRSGELETRKDRMTQQTQIIGGAIDLTFFCAKKDGQYATSKPWAQEGWWYATDQRIAIRIPAGDNVAEVIASDGPKTPPAKNLFKKEVTGDPQPWPDTPFVRKVKICPQCDGKGEVGCDECGADKCLMCDGHGNYEQDIGRRVGVHLIGPHYDKLIRSLPNVRWFSGYDDPLKMLPFVFDGGEGRIMGIGTPK